MIEETNVEDIKVATQLSQLQASAYDKIPIISDEKKKTIKKQKNEVESLGEIQILDYPNRTLPKLLEELVAKGFTVILGKDGYYIEGFYGLNKNMLDGGYILAQDTTVANTLALSDAKGGKHFVKNFKDIVFLNNTIWGTFFKIPEYKKPNQKWFPHLVEYGALNISPK